MPRCPPWVFDIVRLLTSCKVLIFYATNRSDSSDVLPSVGSVSVLVLKNWSGQASGEIAYSEGEPGVTSTPIE
jgi:hypothetical protein